MAFLSNKLTAFAEKRKASVKSFTPEEINGCIDALGLPFGFKYSRQFLFKAFELLPTVQKVDENGNFRVPSEKDSSIVYSVSLNPFNCTCPAFARFKMTHHPYCKHIATAMLRDQAHGDGYPIDLIEFCDRYNGGDYKWCPDNSSFGYTPSEGNPQAEVRKLPPKALPDNPERLVVIFSTSQLDTYTRCPAQYFFRWIEKRDSKKLSSSLAFDRAMKAAIYADKGYEPDTEVPLEEKWRPELDIACDAVQEGKSLDVVFSDTFQWVCDENEVDWKKDVGLKPSSFDDSEFDEILHRGRVLACLFDEQLGELSAEPMVKMRTTMVDSETGLVVQTNGTPASVQCSFDLIGEDGVIYKLKTSSRSISKLTYDWTLDLQRFVYQQLKGDAPTGVKIVNLVRTKKPKMQVLDAPEPRTSRTLAICESVIASINARAFYPNTKNLYGCEKCDYVSACDAKW